MKLYKFKNKLNIQYFVLFIVLSLFLLYSLFFKIPTENLSVGIGSTILDIGDLQFYINGFDVKDNSYWDEKYVNNIQSIVKPSFLYPLILKIVTFFCGLFKLPVFSKLWNFLLITFTSICSFSSLFFIDKSTRNFFGSEAANIARWIFILNPYTLFYAISGGITSYMVLGISFFCYLLSKSKIFNNHEGNLNELQTIFFMFLATIFLSSLRPTGAIYSLVILIITNIFIYNLKEKESLKKKFIIYFFLYISIIYACYQLYLTSAYIKVSINVFLDERGSYFGVDREYLRLKLINNSSNFIENIKNTIYLIIWKIGDFVSGISDIRDTHSILNKQTEYLPLFPFLARITTGLFFLYPLNLFSFAALIYSRKIIFRSGLWILLMASIISLLPNLFGFSFSRYLIMFYSPFIIISSSIIHGLINQNFESKIK